MAKKGGKTKVKYRTRYVKVRSRRRSKPAVPILPLAGAVGGGLELWSVYDSWKKSKTSKSALMNSMSARLFAFEPQTGRFNPTMALRFWGPVVGGFVAHKVANWMGINRMLARYRIPIRL